MDKTKFFNDPAQGNKSKIWSTPNELLEAVHPDAPKSISVPTGDYDVTLYPKYSLFLTSCLFKQLTREEVTQNYMVISSLTHFEAARISNTALAERGLIEPKELPRWKRNK